MGKLFSLKLFNSLLTDTKLITYYQFLRLGTNILIAILFSKFFFNTHTLAQYETIVLTVSSFVFFWNTGFVRFFQSYYANYKHTLHNFLNQIFSTSAGIGLLTAFCYLSLTLPLNSLNTLIAAKIFTSIIANPIEYYGIALKKHKIVFFIITVYFLAFFTWTVYAYRYHTFETLLLGWLLLDFLKIITFYLNLTFRFTFLKGIVLCNLIFLSLSALLSGGVEYINFWLVKQHYNDTDFLIYRYGAREIPFSALLAYSLSASLTAQIRIQNLSTQQINQKITQLIHLTFPISIVLLVLSKPLFQLLYGQSLYLAYQVFDIFLLLNISRVMLFDIYLLANQKHRFFLFTSLFELIVVSVITYYGIYNHWNISNIAFSVFITYFFERIILLWKLKIMKIKSLNFFPWKIWGIYSIIIAILYVLKRIL